MPGLLEQGAQKNLCGGARRVETQYEAQRVPLERLGTGGRAEDACQGLHLQQVRMQEKILRLLQEASCVHHEMQVPRV
ncbi:hypothetical protein HU200_036525 [Digitaria exilis]|uniref:Uncharacterized protein n=1 Tax=Digitaria exilis TaxID=1010633 RepID=A0A835EKB3_9POAL|nr:hypothetical protein HU200_036525 [Digitaria exilis]